MTQTLLQTEKEYAGRSHWSLHMEAEYECAGQWSHLIVDFLLSWPVLLISINTDSSYLLSAFVEGIL